ncbi:MAG: AraC family transcriptional regulator [Sphingobium sp.]
MKKFSKYRKYEERMEKAMLDDSPVPPVPLQAGDPVKPDAVPETLLVPGEAGSAQALTGSLSDFIRALELRSQCWCHLAMSADTGFRVVPSGAFLFYAMLEGSAAISGLTPEPIPIGTGEMVFILADRPHSLRPRPQCAVQDMRFLSMIQQIDILPTLTVGQGPAANRMICGRLEVRWPGETQPAVLPPHVRIAAGAGPLQVGRLARSAEGTGAAAVMTHCASLAFANAILSDEMCHRRFAAERVRNPIASAIRLMENRPFEDWTVNSLAQSVGVSRSTLAARFLSGIGKTPIEKLTDLRMDLAATLLAQTDLTVSEIGQRVGYRSDSAFTRRFHSYFSKSPGQMRLHKRLQVCAHRPGMAEPADHLMPQQQQQCVVGVMS